MHLPVGVKTDNGRKCSQNTVCTVGECLSPILTTSSIRFGAGTVGNWTD